MIAETFQTLELHTHRANQAYDEVMGFAALMDVETLNDFDKVKVIDSFIFRFIKIQDLMGNKLFKEILKALGEYQPSMSMLDVLDRLEQLELLDSVEQWMDYRNLRNVLTHEYPDNKEELLEGIQEALKVFHDIRNIHENMLKYAKGKGLMSGEKG